MHLLNGHKRMNAQDGILYTATNEQIIKNKDELFSSTKYSASKSGRNYRVHPVIQILLIGNHFFWSKIIQMSQSRNT